MIGKKYWMCGELNPGPLPCEGSVIPLHHTPEGNDMHYNSLIKSMNLSKLKTNI